MGNTLFWFLQSQAFAILPAIKSPLIKSAFRLDAKQREAKVGDQCWSIRVQYSYSSTTRVPFFEYSYSEPQVLGWYSYLKVNVLGTRSKKEPSTRVHLVFAKSNKQNVFLIVNCSQ